MAFSLEEQKLHEKQHELSIAISTYLQNKEGKLNWLVKNNELVKPDNILRRGFSITTQNGKAVKSIKDIDKNSTIETILVDGKIISKVKDKK